MARSALLNTDTEDLQEIFANGKSYRVPMYQRDYSWKAEHWEDLWEDIVSLENAVDQHYMGAIVLETIEDKQYQIVDGQQRLATLSMLILACIDWLHLAAEAGNDPQNNTDRAALLESSYIGARDPVSLQVVSKLGLNRMDNAFWRSNIVRRMAPVSVRTLTASERALWDCLDFFRKRVRFKFSMDTPGEDIARFVNDVVARRLLFITIRVHDQLSAYTVFETLNARGLELTETDLLKNYLLSLADTQSKSQIEPILEQWERITEHAGVARFPEFLRHHLNSRRPFVRQKELFKVIRRDITELHQVYELLDALERDAVLYHALRDHSSDFWADFEGAAPFVRMLNLFNVTQYTPLALAASRRYQGIPREFVRILKMCATISFRFNVVSQRSTHILESVYNRAALALAENPEAALVDVCREVREIYVPDREFEADFSTFRLKAGGRSAKRLRYILVELEKSLAPKDLDDETTSATLEHVLPRHAEEGSEWHSLFDRERMAALVERLGNYTLLERELNKQAANLSFEDKRAMYASSQYALARQIADDFGNWNAKAIESRQKKLAKRATGIWRFDGLG